MFWTCRFLSWLLGRVKILRKFQARRPADVESSGFEETSRQVTPACRCDGYNAVRAEIKCNHKMPLLSKPFLLFVNYLYWRSIFAPEILHSGWDYINVRLYNVWYILGKSRVLPSCLTSVYTALFGVIKTHICDSETKNKAFLFKKIDGPIIRYDTDLLEFPWGDTVNE